ncbi:hypothetical protein AB0A77_02135 [Streptomyces varsoviensis]|uniref:hypothetical protein n=1 Tax=Streptomyces varsoviensis TaxID=67373 RepID=UPI003407C74C
MTERIVVIRPGPPIMDSRGNERPGPPTETTVDYCAVLPPGGQAAPTTEVTVGRDVVTISRVLFAPSGTDVRATDKIRHAGREYEVVGEPSPYPVLPHLEANLKSVSG